MNICIFYATGKGDTKKVCQYLADKLGSKIAEVKNAAAGDFEKFDFLIFASPSYGKGELHEDWVNKLDMLKSLNLNNKKVAIVGVGNQQRHGDSFCSGVAKFLPIIKAGNATLIGQSELDGYKFEYSDSFKNGKFIGLMLDTKGDKEYEKRIDKWIDKIKNKI